MDVDRLLRARSERDRFFAEHYSSPLPEEHRPGFAGLDYFALDPAWEIAAAYEPIDALRIPVLSTAGVESMYTMAGRVVLRIFDSNYRLTALDDGDGGAFIPFRDGTSGNETYDGGRYVGIAIECSGAVTVDFNTAQNPWCVYDEEFTCPLPPKENWIAESIPAGEKMYEPRERPGTA